MTTSGRGRTETEDPISGETSLLGDPQIRDVYTKEEKTGFPRRHGSELLRVGPTRTDLGVARVGLVEPPSPEGTPSSAGSQRRFTGTVDAGGARGPQSQDRPPRLVFDRAQG